MRDLEQSVSEAIKALPMPQQPVGMVGGVSTQDLMRQAPPSPVMHDLRYKAPTPPSPFEHAVRDELYKIGNLLIDKNAKYGDSALNPLRIFSSSHPIEQILVRIDDKLSRIRNGYWDQGEDTIEDLMGYLVLLQVARKSAP